MPRLDIVDGDGKVLTRYRVMRNRKLASCRSKNSQRRYATIVRASLGTYLPTLSARRDMFCQVATTASGLRNERGVSHITSMRCLLRRWVSHAVEGLIALQEPHY